MQILKMHGIHFVLWQRMGDIKKEINKLLRVLESGKPDVKAPASGKGGREWARGHPKLWSCLSVSVTVTQTIVTWEDGLLTEELDCPAHKSMGHSSWLMIDVEGSSPLQVVPPLGRRASHGAQTPIFSGLSAPVPAWSFGFSFPPWWTVILQAKQTLPSSSSFSWFSSEQKANKDNYQVNALGKNPLWQ